MELTATFGRLMKSAPLLKDASASGNMAVLKSLLGPAWRGRSALTHLWHPHPPRMDRKRGSPENWARHRRYTHARQSRQAMEALIGEARESLSLAHPVLHDPAALDL